MFTSVKDLDLKIVSQLELNDIFNFMQVSKYLSELCKNNIIWRYKLIQDFPLRSKFEDKYIFNCFDHPYSNLSCMELYHKIIQKSKYIELNNDNASDIKLIFKFKKEWKELFHIFNVALLNEFTEIMKKTKIFKSLPLLRGDVVYFSWIGGYRNDAKLFWDGEKLIQFYHNIDDSGSVPPEFKFPEFPLNHFRDTVDHNGIVWFTNEKVQEIISNIDTESFDIPCKDNETDEIEFHVICDKFKTYVTDNYNTKFRFKVSVPSCINEYISIFKEGFVQKSWLNFEDSDYKLVSGYNTKTM